MFVKLTAGLTKPFTTSTGVKQGCVLSPLIFNLFINDLPGQYDQHCDPVYVGEQPVHALMFADDVVVFSQSAAGLRRAITTTVEYFTNINLSVNYDKSQVMVFNARGALLDRDPDHVFQVHGHQLKVVREYTYLGFKLTPSGTASHGTDELFSKARRSWFSISNLIYKHKRMSTDRAFRIFDQLVTSIGIYNCEAWLPLLLKKKSLESTDNLLSFWDTLRLETLNQKISRMVLGVHRKTSRLGVIGELGRFPLFIKGLCHALKYQAHLCKANSNTLVGKAVLEMKNNEDTGLKTWWGRLEKIKDLLGLSYSTSSKLESIGNSIKKTVQSKFQIYWLQQLNKIELGSDGKNHNKLRFYSQIKGCFKKEPYLDLVPNRSQRADLTRIRISCSRLAIEVQRYQRPPVPADERFCTYCRPAGSENQLQGYVDNEEHFLMACGAFTFKRNCFLSKLGSVLPSFQSLSPHNKVLTMLCPVTTVAAKLVNKYIKIMFECRNCLDNGIPILNMGYEKGVTINPFFEDLDNDGDLDSDNGLGSSFLVL